jgi:hypothetical protein
LNGEELAEVVAGLVENGLASKYTHLLTGASRRLGEERCSLTSWAVQDMWVLSRS